VKRAKTCIFCGARGSISKEHFWPEWLAKHIPPLMRNAHVSEFHSAEGLQPKQLLRRSERPGGVNTKKIRAVCMRCNNEWMSGLESKAKPPLLALLNGSRSVLALEDAETLGRWAALKSVVGEYAIEGTALTPATERQALWQAQVVPAFFRVFLPITRCPPRPPITATLRPCQPPRADRIPLYLPGSPGTFTLQPSLWAPCAFT
jgi:hypothetical protein